MTATDTPLAEREHIVYRLSAEDGSLLYVGRHNEPLIQGEI